MTPTQLTTLRNAILAETDTAFVELRNSGATGAMADWLNAPHASLRAWNAAASWADVQNAIDYSKYTPGTANIPSDTPGTNRLLAILIKLTVQQNMLIGMADSVDARDAGNVTALLDTVTAVPSGAGGAVVAPGGAQGVNVAAALTRPASRGEALFVTASPVFGNTTAALLSFEGSVSNDDVVQALALQ